MVYNLSNVTNATGVDGFILAINQLTNNAFGSTLFIVLMFVALLSTTQGPLKKMFPIAAFIGSVGALFLWPMGLISGTAATVSLVLTSLFTVMLVVNPLGEN